MSKLLRTQNGYIYLTLANFPVPFHYKPVQYSNIKTAKHLENLIIIHLIGETYCF